jgi:hypothetical protein
MSSTSPKTYYAIYAKQTFTIKIDNLGSLSDCTIKEIRLDGEKITESKYNKNDAGAEIDIEYVPADSSSHKNRKITLKMYPTNYNKHYISHTSVDFPFNDNPNASS